MSETNAPQFPESSLENVSLEVAPGAAPVSPEVLKTMTLRLKLHGGAEIEVPLSEINMGSAHVRGAGRTPGTRYFKCGNCGGKFPLTGDPEQDHHTAMKHRVETCPKIPQAQTEHVALLQEHAHQRAKQLPLGAGLPRLPAAGEDWRTMLEEAGIPLIASGQLTPPPGPYWCQSCSRNEVVTLGDFCHTCRAREWERGEKARRKAESRSRRPWWKFWK